MSMYKNIYDLSNTTVLSIKMLVQKGEKKKEKQTSLWKRSASRRQWDHDGRMRENDPSFALRFRLHKRERKKKRFSRWGKLSVDENSVVQGAQLVELPLNVGVELVEIWHVVLRGRAIAWNNVTTMCVPPSFSRPLLTFDLTPARFYTLSRNYATAPLATARVCGTWQRVICFVTRTRVQPRVQKSKEYYFKTLYGVKA